MATRNSQCKITGTKGISDAVRNAVSEWITPQLVEILYAEYKKSVISKPFSMALTQFRIRLEDSEEWKRYSRGNDPNGAGFFRKYYCKSFVTKGMVDLHVLTNYDDTQIKYVTFHVQGKLVYGGAVNVPSLLMSQAGKNATIVEKKLMSAVFGDAVKTTAFVPFTGEQLRKLSIELEFGGMSAIDRMLEDRV